MPIVRRADKRDDKIFCIGLSDLLGILDLLVYRLIIYIYISKADIWSNTVSIEMKTYVELGRYGSH